jgi:hypothetical protein
MRTVFSGDTTSGSFATCATPCDGWRKPLFSLWWCAAPIGRHVGTVPRLRQLRIRQGADVWRFVPFEWCPKVERGFPPGMEKEPERLESFQANPPCSGAPAWVPHLTAPAFHFCAPGQSPAAEALRDGRLMRWAPVRRSQCGMRRRFNHLDAQPDREPRIRPGLE